MNNNSPDKTIKKVEPQNDQYLSYRNNTIPNPGSSGGTSNNVGSSHGRNKAPFTNAAMSTLSNQVKFWLIECKD